MALTKIALFCAVIAVVSAGPPRHTSDNNAARSNLVKDALEPQMKDDGCGEGFCYCNGGCHTCQSCRRSNLVKDALEPQVKDDGCGEGFCYCNGGCHTCQSCRRFNLVRDALEPQVKDDGV